MLIPDGWVGKALGEVAVKIQDGTHFSPKSTEGSCRYLTSKNVRFGYLDLTDCGWISQKEHDQIYKRCDVRKGDLLVTKDGANTGNATLNPLDEPFSLLSSVAMLRLDEKRASARYLLHYLLSPSGQNRLKFGMSGNAITRLTLEKIRAFQVPFPDVDVQNRIADILDAADAAIRQTEAVIAKLRQMKAGLLHDLLTRGLDEQGRLRDPQRHPEQFKDTPLGRIPKEWKLIRLEEVGDWQSGGTPSKENPRFWGGSIPWASAKDMKSFLLNDTQDHITDLASGVGAKLVPPGSILILVRGMTLANTLPVCLTGSRMAFNQDVRAIVPNQAISPKYLGYWLISQEDRILGLATEATHGTKRIDLADLQNVMLPLPSKSEQDRIVGIVEQHDLRLSAEVTSVGKLKLQKRGLMHDLLTGRVRV